MQIRAPGGHRGVGLRAGVTVMTILLAATAVRAQPPGRPEASATEPRKLCLGWFVYEDAPGACPDPAREVAKYLTAKLKNRPQPIEIDAVNIRNYAVEDVLRTGPEAVDLVYFTPYTYVLAERSIPGANQSLAPGKEPPLRPIVSYAFHGARERFSTIVWKAKEGATLKALLDSLHNDRRKKLALVDPHSSSGFLWPSRLLGGGPEISRGKVTTVFAGTHDAALNFFKDFDEVAAAVSFDTHLVEYIAKHKDEKGFPEYRSSALTPPLPLDVIAARDSVKPAEGDAIRDAMLAMKPGEDVFDHCFAKKLDRWIKADRSYYDLVRAFMKVTEPAPSLRLAANCEPMRTRISNELAGWFSMPGNDRPAVADGMRIIDLSCASGDKTLSKELGKLRDAYFITGYINEEAAVDSGPGEQNIRASFGSRRGLVPGMAAVIKRRIWLADDSVEQGSPLETPARITEVLEGGEVHLRAVDGVGQSSVKQDLDPNDRMIMWVEVHGYSSDVGGAEDEAKLELDVEDASITPAGGMEVEYHVHVRSRENEKPLPANPWGWLLETSREGAPGKLELVPPGGSGASARIALGGNSLSSRVTVRMLGSPSGAASVIGGASGCAGNKAACVSSLFGFWSGLPVWIFVFLGGLIGTGLRWAGRATESPAEKQDGSKASRDVRWWVRLLARHGVELATGLGTALLLFLVFVTVKPDMLKALDSNAIITRLGVGAAGGVIGASGLGALVHRLVGLKS